MDYVEGIKLVGSIVGLLTGGFVVWERLVKNRPSIMLRADPPKGYQGDGSDIFLSIINPSARPIFVDIPDHVGGLAFIEGREIADAVRSGLREQTKEPIQLLVGAKATAEVEVASPSLRSTLDDVVKLKVAWRPVHFSRFDPAKLLRLPLILEVSNSDIRRMRKPSYRDDLQG